MVEKRPKRTRPAACFWRWELETPKEGSRSCRDRRKISWYPILVEFSGEYVLHLLIGRAISQVDSTASRLVV